MKYDHLLNIELFVDHVIEYALWCAQIALKSVRIISAADVVLFVGNLLLTTSHAYIPIRLGLEHNNLLHAIV